MAASPTQERWIHQQLGRYRILESLGHGGMAEVFVASDEKLGRRVAVKVLLPTVAADPAFLERFLREARVVASLEHPHILPIYDVGEHEGVPFLVMPWVRSGTLADRMVGEPLDPAAVRHWIGALATALDAAHTAGVLHRDVKPGNVLIGDQDRLFLADFGIARLQDATRLTHTGMVVGTPVYMAPEVAGGESAVAASDLYSLAVLAYEMLAGRPPFEGENVLSILHQHATRPVPPITTRVGHLPSGVDGILRQGLAKEPAERPANCTVFAESLSSALPQTPGHAAPASAVTAPAGDAVPTLPLEAAANERTLLSSSDAYGTMHGGVRGWGRLRQWAAAGFIGALAALAGIWLFRGTEESVPGETPASAVTEPQPAPGSASSEPAATPQQHEVPSDSAASSVASPTSPPEPVPALSAPTEPPAQSAVGPSGSSPWPVFPGPGPHGGRPGAPGRDLLASLPLQGMRGFIHRPSAEDLTRAQEVVARLPPGRGPGRLALPALRRYLEGGVAYGEGRLGVAKQVVSELMNHPQFLNFWGPGPLMVLAATARARKELEDWELALVYRDPDSQLGAHLDRELLAAPEEPRWLFARALSHRLDREPQAVIDTAELAFDALSDDTAAEVRSYVALVIADAYGDLGQSEEALDWYRQAVSAGGRFQGLPALRGAELAQALGQGEQATEWRETACQAGMEAACEPDHRPGRRRLRARR